MFYFKLCIYIETKEYDLFVELGVIVCL